MNLRRAVPGSPSVTATEQAAPTRLQDTTANRVPHDRVSAGDLSNAAVAVNEMAGSEINDRSERISALTAIPYAIPYDKPLKFASGSIARADNVVVRVETTSGYVGYAEAPPRPYTYGETQKSIVAAVEDIFAPGLVGTSIFSLETVRERMAGTVGNPTAKAAVDMAAYDAVGKISGISVHQLLGGYCDRLEVSHMLGFDSPAMVAEEATSLREEYGINSFKIKVGRHPITEDVAVCRAVRNALGETAEIYLDGNRGWSATESATALRRLSDVGISRVEELNPADEVLSRKWLVDRTDVLFVADESAPTAADVTRQVLLGTANAVSIKTARTGFTDSQRTASLAEGLGLEVFVGNQIDAHLGTACSVNFGAARKSTSRNAAELSNFLDLSDSILTEPLVIQDGLMPVPHGPGLGVDVDVEKLTYYRVDR